jgi:hypothetical protein
MQTNYRPHPAIPFAQLFDGRLDKYGVREKIGEYSTETARQLKGCDCVLQVFREEDGSCTFTCSNFRPLPSAVLEALIEEFAIEVVSEHDYRYWGFSSEEKWNAVNEKLAKESEDKLYNNILHFVRGEPDDLEEGSFEFQQAEIAKALIQNDPSLMAPEKRGVLLEAVMAIFDQENGLTDREWAELEMMIARPKDLPQA